KEMNIMSVGIIGTGHYAPDNVVTNKDLEKIVDTTDEWIRSRTGIEERRIATDDEDSSDMAFEAAKKALADADLTGEDIDLILVALDVSTAYAGFMYGVITDQQFIETGVYNHVLVIGVDKLSKIPAWTDRNTCVLLGDGAGAAILGKVSDNRWILSFELGSDGS